MTFCSMITQGLSLDYIFLLQVISRGDWLVEERKIPRIGAIIQYLERNGYINSEGVTQEGFRLLKDFEGNLVGMRGGSVEEGFVQRLHGKIKKVLKDNTGAEQVPVIIQKNKYYFLCGSKDLEKVLLRFKKEYGSLWNEAKVETAILKYVDECSKKDTYPMLVQYWILHSSRGSALATALENPEEEKKVNEYYGTNI